MISEVIEVLKNQNHLFCDIFFVKRLIFLKSFQGYQHYEDANFSLNGSMTSKDDRAEGHDFWSRFLLFILFFFFPLFLRGKRNGEKNNHFCMLLRGCIFLNESNDLLLRT